MILAAVVATSTASGVYTVLAAIVALLSLIAIFGGASAYFTSKRGEKTIELLTVDNETLKGANERLSRENDAKDRQLAELANQVATLTTQVQTLKDLVSAEKAIKDLEITMNRQHAELLKAVRARPARRDA